MRYWNALLSLFTIACASSPASRPVAKERVEYQIEKSVAPLPGNRYPHYPPSLRATNLVGSVDAQFFVDVNGRVDMRTFEVLRSDHELFTAAVKAALPGMRYLPAEVNGRKMRVQAQQTFKFSTGPQSKNP